MTLEEITNSIFLELSKIYHIKRIDKNILGLLNSNNENYDLIIIDRNKPKLEKRVAGETGSISTDVTIQRPGPKDKKTKAELREIALKAVATRKRNNPDWASKKKPKTKTLKK